MNNPVVEICIAIFCALLIVAIPAVSINFGTQWEVWLPALFGFFGTILGALIGVFSTYHAQSISGRKERRARAFSLFIKAQMTHSSLTSLYKHMGKTLSESDALGLKDYPACCRLSPFLGIPKVVSYESQELAVLVDARQTQLVERLMEQSFSLSGLIDLLAAYNSTWDEWTAGLRTNEIDGQIIWTKETVAQQTKSSPQFLAADSLANTILLEIADAQKKSEVAFSQLVLGLREALDDPYFLKL